MRFIALSSSHDGGEELTFNSLYEILRWNLHKRPSSGSGHYFQFSLWDSAGAVYECPVELNVFQFSLWDSEWVDWANYPAWYAITFNSLYEIQKWQAIWAKYIDIRPLAFNSLYEIPPFEKIRKILAPFKTFNSLYEILWGGKGG